MHKQITRTNAYALAKAMADQTAFEWFRKEGWGEVEDMECDIENDPDDEDFVDLSFRIVWQTQDNYNETHSEYIQFNSVEEFWNEYNKYFGGGKDE